MTLPSRSLPPLVAVTNRRQCEAHDRSLVETVERAIEGGLRAVVLRDKDMPSPDREEAAFAIRSALDAVDGVLIVASDPALAVDAKADGVHLAAGDPFTPGGSLIVGRSTHSRDELVAAIGDGVDYVSLSPIFETRSKPGYGPALGLTSLAEATMVLGVPPIFALGGVNGTNARKVKAAGAVGAFVMGSIMASSDPAAAVAKLTSELT